MFLVKVDFSTFIGLQADFRKVIVSIFNPEEPLVSLTGFQHYFEISTPVEISTKLILAEPTNENLEKLNFFRIA